MANNFIGKLMAKKEIALVFTSFKVDYPQLQLEVDDDKANQLGVNLLGVLQTMQAYFGSAQDR